MGRNTAETRGQGQCADSSHPANLDCARTFNRGLELACGKYCGILAADDTWEPDFVAKCVAALEKYPEVAFCYCRINLLNRDGAKHPRGRDRIPHREIIRT
ncbi:glycosyltransferase family 2 protein [bacterium]|nr:glycosyltransferase family 2 protein [bacterium]